MSVDFKVTGTAPIDYENNQREIDNLMDEFNAIDPKIQVELDSDRNGWSLNFNGWTETGIGTTDEYERLIESFSQYVNSPSYIETFYGNGEPGYSIYLGPPDREEELISHNNLRVILPLLKTLTYEDTDALASALMNPRTYL